MPCRDYDDDGRQYGRFPSPTESPIARPVNFKERANQLAADKCRMGSIIFKLHNKQDVDKKDILWALHEYVTHRENDKRAALTRACEDIVNLENRIKNIEGLGGHPSADQQEQLVYLKELQDAVQKSLPTNTSLY